MQSSTNACLAYIAVDPDMLHLVWIDHQVAADLLGASDPYVVLAMDHREADPMTGRTGEEVRKTQIKKRTLNPKVC